VETGARKVAAGRGNDVEVEAGQGTVSGVGEGEGEAGAQAENNKVMKIISADRKSSLAAACLSGKQATGSTAGVPVIFISNRSKVQILFERGDNGILFIHPSGE
jgi:hypothetical protein